MRKNMQLCHILELSCNRARFQSHRGKVDFEEGLEGSKRCPLGDLENPVWSCLREQENFGQLRVVEMKEQS